MAPHFAAWDFLQNYMDIGHPLPDIPLFEKHRTNNPTTAAHDRRSGLPECYWRDVDDETLKAKVREMNERIPQIGTLSRPNLMTLHMNYAES